MAKRFKREPESASDVALDEILTQVRAEIRAEKRVARARKKIARGGGLVKLRRPLV